MSPFLVVGVVTVVILIIAVFIFMMSQKDTTVISGSPSIATNAEVAIVAPPKSIMGKTITIHRKSGAGGISLTEVILRGPDGKRIVPVRATASSKYSIDGKFDPSKLIDADFGTSARTADTPVGGEVPTLTIDLGVDKPIGTIEIATGGASAAGLAVTVKDSSGRQTLSNTLKVERPYYAFSPAGARLPHPPMPMFTGGKLESFTTADVIGRYVQATSLPKVFGTDGLRLNAANVVVTRGAAPSYTVDLGTNKGIGRINLAGKNGDHAVVVKSARGNTTYAAEVKKN